MSAHLPAARDNAYNSRFSLVVRLWTSQAPAEAANDGDNGNLFSPRLRDEIRLFWKKHTARLASLHYLEVKSSLCYDFPDRDHGNHFLQRSSKSSLKRKAW